MKRTLATLVLATSVFAGAGFGLAQKQNPEVDALQQLMQQEIPQARLDLGMQLVKASGTSRTFNELLPTIAAQSKNAFIRGNPDMQLGIIGLVDKAALDLVRRRPELDVALSRIWAASFTEEELQQLLDFYSSDVGKKFAELHPKILTIEVGTAQAWGRSVSRELTKQVSDELRTAIAAEESALKGDVAAPAPQSGDAAEPAPAQ